MQKIAFAVVALFALTTSVFAKDLNMDPDKWDFGPYINGTEYSFDENGNAIAKDGQGAGFRFDIPPNPGEIDYLKTGCPNDFQSFDKIRLTYDLTGDGNVKATEGEVAARIRLYFQKDGDDWSGTGANEHKRHWSVNYMDLVMGNGQVLEARLDNTQWFSVYGENAQLHNSAFNNAKQDCKNVGLTFGGVFAGHGVRSRNGLVRMRIREYQLLND